jgi:hypothetical protein
MQHIHAGIKPTVEIYNALCRRANGPELDGKNLPACLAQWNILQWPNFTIMLLNDNARIENLIKRVLHYTASRIADGQ